MVFRGRGGRGGSRGGRSAPRENSQQDDQTQRRVIVSNTQNGSDAPKTLSERFAALKETRGGAAPAPNRGGKPVRNGDSAPAGIQKVRREGGFRPNRGRGASTKPASTPSTPSKDTPATPTTTRGRGRGRGAGRGRGTGRPNKNLTKEQLDKELESLK